MLGFIARCDNTGLGMESLDFVTHLQPEKVLVMLTNRRAEFPERFARCPSVTVLDHLPTTREIDAFLDGLDTLFCIETPYEWRLFERARALGVRTVLRVNYEFLPEPVPVQPDVMTVPIAWYQPPSAVVLPFPVDRDRIPFRRRTRASTFVHIAGRQGFHGRNGTAELLRAIPLVRSDVRFVIYSQLPIETIADARVRYCLGDRPDNADLYRDGDVLVYPRRYGGQALSMNEALAAGMPVMMTDMPPQSAILPKAILIPPQRLEEVQILKYRTVEAAVVEPSAIAAKIDEWAHEDISMLSDHADEYARSISWTTLRARYEAILRSPRDVVAGVTS